MVRTRGQMKKVPLPPSAGWRVGHEIADDESENDRSEQVYQEDDSEEEQDVDMADDEPLTGEPPIDEPPIDEEVDRCAMTEAQKRFSRGRQGRREEPDETDSAQGWKDFPSILLFLILILGTGCAMYLYREEIRLFCLGITDSGLHTLVGFRFLFSSPGSSFSSPPSPSPLTTWEKFKEKFKNEFTPKYLNAVPKSSIKVIKAAVKDVMTAHGGERESLSPSVILILGREGNKNVTCFSRDLERMIASSYEEDSPLRIKGESVDASGIEAAFRQVFQEQRHHLIVIDGLNKLDARSAAHLHRFTDHESSVFKEAIIILLGYTDQVTQLRSESSLKEMDSVASELIMRLWAQSLPGDAIAPLISRLTPSVTAVLDWDGQVTIC